MKWIWVLWILELEAKLLPWSCAWEWSDCVLWDNPSREFDPRVRRKWVPQSYSAFSRHLKKICWDFQGLISSTKNIFYWKRRLIWSLILVKHNTTICGQIAIEWFNKYTDNNIIILITKFGCFDYQIIKVTNKPLINIL